MTVSPVSNTSLLNTAGLLSLLDQWVELGWLRSLDVALVRFLDKEARAGGQAADPLLLLAIALASHQLGRGHVCLDIEALAKDGFDDALSLPPEDETAPDRRLRPSDILREVTPQQWRQSLDHALLVADAAAAKDVATPLVRDDMRLYLRRYWQYEQIIHQALSLRTEPLQTMAGADSPEARALQAVLDALFDRSDGETDWQRVACANAARYGFSIITGGPGTGKTTTVVKLLAALQSVAMTSGDQGRALRIRLAAPTGKAAARLNESIAGAVRGLDLSGIAGGEALRAAIPTEVTTLHRLLGSIPGSRRFRHHRGNPLVTDVLVIDEASMVDIEMMANVLEALPQRARLILLGDKDQLASVDAGAVLGELCQRADRGHYLSANADWLARISVETIARELHDHAGSAMDQCLTMLRKSYRFTGDSGIGRLAGAVNQSIGSDVSPGAVLRLFDEGYGDIAKVSLNRHEPGQPLARHCLGGGAAAFSCQGKGLAAPQGYGYYLNLMAQQQPPADATWDHWELWAKQVIAAYSQFQLLCAVRRGPFGVEGLNAAIVSALRQHRLISSTEGWFPGRPVLVTRNDYSLGLMNGDIGITLEVPARHWIEGREVIDPHRRVIRVAFPAGDGSGGVRWVLPSRLQGVETVYAMTVHKSQGSEFAHACLVLPDKLTPVLTRELVYTGITRARRWFSLLLPNEAVFEGAIRRQVTRTSGLGRMLFGE